MTHGSKSKRQHGSIGSSATPSRVFPGLKMAGKMGNERKTLRNLKVGVVRLLSLRTCLLRCTANQNGVSRACCVCKLRSKQVVR
jgi:ribosomal protein L3